IKEVVAAIITEYKKLKPSIANGEDATDCETESELVNLNKCIQKVLADYNIEIEESLKKELEKKCTSEYFENHCAGLPVSIQEAWQWLNGISKKDSGLRAALQGLEGKASPFCRRKVTSEAIFNYDFCMAIQVTLAAMNDYHYRKHKDLLNF